VELHLGFRMRLHAVLRNATQTLFFNSASLSRHDVSSRVDVGESLQSCLATASVYSMNSHGEPPNWGLGKGLNVPQQNRAICYEISDLGDLSGLEIFWGVML
jgi:hypothetical protein